MLNPIYVDDIIKTALLEDISYVDVSGAYVFTPAHTSRGQIVAKAAGVVCGLAVFARVFSLLDSAVEVHLCLQDGDTVSPGDKLATLCGPTASLLRGERVALNFLQHMSGIATATRAACAAVAGTGAAITDTRKTLPGLRPLQKYAVVCGGGKNHRYNLSDAVMLKDNHIDAAGSITAAVKAVRAKAGHMCKLEVETRTLDEVREALAAGADVIMLDNMGTEEMAEAVAIVDGRALLEASGNITLATLGTVAATGVDIISMGALTHSVQAFDISMRLDG